MSEFKRRIQRLYASDTYYRWVLGAVLKMAAESLPGVLFAAVLQLPPLLAPSYIPIPAGSFTLFGGLSILGGLHFTWNEYIPPESPDELEAEAGAENGQGSAGGEAVDQVDETAEQTTE